MGSKAESQFRFRHFPELDGFRGLAVLFVVAGHGVQFSGSSASRVGGPLASLGVALFFVLSGFLISGLLYRERAETGQVNLVNFYARRLIRLGPALLLFLAVSSVLIALKRITDVPWYELAACVLYLRNIYGRSMSLGHLWSLSLEEQFYLLWPQFLKRVDPDRLLKYTLGLIALIWVWRGFAIWEHLFDYNGGIYYMRPYFRFDSILIGCCISLAAVRTDFFLKYSARISGAIGIFLAWSGLFLWVIFVGQSTPLYITGQTLGCALVLSQVLVGKYTPISAFFSSGVVRYVGKISYSLYLWQELFLVVKNPSWGILRTFPVNIVLSFGCAMASYYLLEAPLLKLKNRFEPGITNLTKRDSVLTREVSVGL